MFPLKMEEVRNNTDFYSEVKTFLDNLKIPKDDPFRYHQRIVIEYVQKYPVRGLLLYHKMGAGKSILAAALAHHFVKQKHKVLFLSVKTLHANFQDTLKKLSEMLDEPDIFNEELYNFVSLNASNMYKQVEKVTRPKLENILEGEVKSKGNLDGFTVIVDEAHNLFNSVANGSDNAVRLYKLIMDSKCKVIFLTGSPITNDPYEIAVGMNMLAGRNKGMALFGENYLDFHKYFVGTHGDDEMPKLINAAKFMNRIAGLISYYGADDPKFLKLLPKQLDTIVEHIPMSAKQYKLYLMARKQEREEAMRGPSKARTPPMQKPKGASSSYRVNSRQFSNFVFPDYASKVERDINGKMTYQKFPDKLKLEDLVWGKGLEKYSPKIQRLLENMQNFYDHKFVKYEIGKPLPKHTAKGLGIIYSQFIEVGLGIIGSVLKAHGWREIKDVNDAVFGSKDKSLSFATISGDVPPEVRADLVKIFNDDNNKRGEALSLLLISSTGAEGLDLKNIRHINIFEPYWHYSRISQVIGRGVRLGSHLELPEKDRTVQPFIYLSDHMAKIESDEPTTDVQLYEKAVKNQILINSFFEAMQKTAFDCTAHYKDCRMCAPNNRRLFAEDIGAAMQSANNCEPLEEKKITAKEIKIGDSVYMYYQDDLGNIHILEYNPSFDAYEEISEGHGDYETIMKKLEKLL